MDGGRYRNHVIKKATVRVHTNESDGADGELARP